MSDLLNMLDQKVLRAGFPTGNSSSLASDGALLRWPGDVGGDPFGDIKRACCLLMLFFLRTCCEPDGDSSEPPDDADDALAAGASMDGGGGGDGDTIEELPGRDDAEATDAGDDDEGEDDSEPWT